jgi:hypothetical protein
MMMKYHASAEMMMVLLPLLVCVMMMMINVVVYRLAAGKASFLGPDSRCVLRNARCVCPRCSKLSPFALGVHWNEFAWW